MAISLVLLVLACACFLVETVQKRSVMCLGLALWVLAQILGHALR